MNENRDHPFCKKCNLFHVEDFKYCPFCATELEIIKNPSLEKWAKGEYKEKELEYNPYHHHWESEFYPLFEEWLKEGFKTKGFNGLTFNNVRFAKVSGIRELDVVGIYRWNRSKRYVLTSIEVKLDKFSETLQQAQARLCLFDYCYIAFPITYAIGSVLHDLILHSDIIVKDGIGVLIYDHVRKKTWEVFSPRKSKMISQKHRTRLIELLNGLSGGKLYNLEPFLKKTIDEFGREKIADYNTKGRISIEDLPHIKRKEVKKCFEQEEMIGVEDLVYVPVDLSGIEITREYVKEEYQEEKRINEEKENE